MAAARRTGDPRLLLLLFFLSRWRQSSSADPGAGRELRLFFSGLATQKNFNKRLSEFWGLWDIKSPGSPPLGRGAFAFPGVYLHTLTCLVLHASELHLSHTGKDPEMEMPGSLSTKILGGGGGVESLCGPHLPHQPP